MDLQKHTVKISRTAGKLNKSDKDGNAILQFKGEKYTKIVACSAKMITSQHVITICTELWNDFVEYKQKQDEIKSALDSNYMDEDYIFNTFNDMLYDPRTYKNLFK